MARSCQVSSTQDYVTNSPCCCYRISYINAEPSTDIYFIRSLKLCGTDHLFFLTFPASILILFIMFRSISSFFLCRRSVLNAQDILSYILTRYNVTVRVTTFSEPRLEAMELMGHTDVLIGMHGAGWTNAIFIKRGAGALQLMPYGWIFPNGDVVRG